MFSIFAHKENRAAITFLEHFRTSLNPWTLVATKGGRMQTQTFPPQLHGAAAEWIAKANLARNVVTLIAEPKAVITGVALVQGHIRGTRHFAVVLLRKHAAKLDVFRPAPFMRLDTGLRIYAVWRLAVECQIGVVEPIASAVAAQVGGVNAGWLVPVAGTTYEGARVELIHMSKERVNVLTDFNRLEAKIEPQAGLFTAASNVQAESETWLWPGVVLSGALMLISGQPKAGKTQITLDCAARVSAGLSWPTGEACEAGRVAVFELEDKAASSIVPRLMAMGADVRNIVVRDAKDGPLNLAEDMDKVAASLAAIGGVKLLTLSPLLSFFGQQASDDTEVRRRLAPLLKWAARTGAAIIGVLHPPKRPGASLEAQFAGADTYRRAARGAWVVAPDMTDPEPDIKLKRRALMCAGINGAPDDLRLFFKIRGATVDGISTSRIEWLSSNDELGEVASKPRTVAERHTRPTIAEFPRSPRTGGRSKAGTWLQTALAEGPRDAVELKREAKRCGVSNGALYRAAEQLGVTIDGGGDFEEKTWSL